MPKSVAGQRGRQQHGDRGDRTEFRVHTNGSANEDPDQADFGLA